VPTPQAPTRNRQTRKVANAKVHNRYTNLTYIIIGLPIIQRLRFLAFAALALAVFGAIECIPLMFCENYRYFFRGAFDSAKIRQRQRRKRLSS